jgi:hypothetical protein
MDTHSDMIVRTNQIVTIKLSEHRKAFRSGGQGVDVLVARINGRDVEFVVDEKLEESLKDNIRLWYEKCGAFSFRFKEQVK